jgi:hypothetical protein
MPVQLYQLEREKYRVEEDPCRRIALDMKAALEHLLQLRDCLQKGKSVNLQVFSSQLKDRIRHCWEHDFLNRLQAIQIHKAQAKNRWQEVRDKMESL